MKNIVIAGSINMDIVFQLYKYPQKGETVTGKNLSFIPGGKGANQARAISRLGGKVRLISKVGQDQFGEALLESLNKEGISTKSIKLSPRKTSGVALIEVDKQAENKIIIIPGSNYDFSSKDLAQISLKDNEIAISQFEIPKETVKEFFSKAKKTGSITVLNPSPVSQIPHDLLRLVDYLIINEHEFAYLSKIKQPQIHAEVLTEVTNKIAGKNQVIIVTFGSKGSIAVKGQKIIKTPGFKVKAADTTGAGDAFLGAFSQALAERKGLNDALIFANATAALKVTKLGASSMPYRKEVEKFMEKLK